MGFRNLDNETILEKLIHWVHAQSDRITDFNPGSAIRTLLEAVSMQIEEFYYDLYQAVMHAIQNSAYHAFGFVKKGARRSTGTVTIFFQDPLMTNKVFEQGTIFYTGNFRLSRVEFKSTERILCVKGAQSATIPVECTIPGKIGNVRAGEISKLSIGYANVDFIANLEDFNNGLDKETDIERKRRFAEYVHTLARGTKEALAYCIKQVPGVHGVYVDDQYIGTVITYVHDQEGNLPPSLAEAVRLALNSYRSAGIEVQVNPVVKREVNVHLKVKYQGGVSPQDYNEALADTIRGFLSTRQVAEPMNYSNLVSAVYDVYRDIISYIDLEDMTDVYILNNELIRPGEIIVEGVE